MKQTENAYFNQPPTDYETDPMVMIEVSRTFDTINDPTGVGIRVPEMTKLQNNMPDQFGIAFVLDSALRGDGNLGREKITLSRNGVVKFQITIGGQPIFKKGPMDWRDNSAVKKKRWEMQCDFWGKEGNPMRHKSCTQKWQHIADGQKWAWIILNLNANGGMHHINKFDFQVEITVWTDGLKRGLRVVIFWLDPRFSRVTTRSVTIGVDLNVN